MSLSGKSITQRLFMCFGLSAFGLAPGAFCETWAEIFAGIDGTFPQSINDAGRITGYSSVNGVLLPFIREADGTMTGFSVPGTFGIAKPLSINATGAITGYYKGPPPSPNSPPPSLHGFVRSPEGNITSFDPPGSTNTQAYSINSGGAITGYYNEANLVIHGFFREPNGKITSFDPPDSISTTAISVNAVGAITGYYQKANGSVHGFLRHPTGHFTSFDPPGSTGTYPASINYSGAITGYYTKADGQHGFVRDAGGKITLFDGVPTSINDEGAITGTGGGSIFVRDPGGTITLPGVPPFCSTPQLSVTGINADGVIIGNCSGLTIYGLVGYP